MDRRVIADSVVSYAMGTRPDFGLSTSIPSVIVRASQASGPLYAMLVRDGRHFTLRISEYKGFHSWRSTFPGRAKIRIPAEFAADLGVKRGDTLDWYFASKPGQPIKFQVSRGGSGRARKKIPGRCTGPVRTVPLALKQINTYDQRGSRYYQAVMPKPCLRLLGAEDADYARWLRTGRSYSMELCGADEDGARKITRSTNRSGATSCIIFFTNRVGEDLYGGKESYIRWLAAADGRGGWEIRVERA